MTCSALFKQYRGNFNSQCVYLEYRFCFYSLMHYYCGSFITYKKNLQIIRDNLSKMLTIDKIKVTYRKIWIFYFSWTKVYTS